MMKYLSLFLLASLSLLIGGGCGESQTNTSGTRSTQKSSRGSDSTIVLIEIENMGTMALYLYDETPLHKAHFLTLIEANKFDGSALRRIVKGLRLEFGTKEPLPMITKEGRSFSPTLTAEINPKFFHKKGALVAARMSDGTNPTRASLMDKFWIVLGRPNYSDELQKIEAYVQKESGNPRFAFTKEQKEIYRTLGGMPALDGQYTVFGEIIAGGMLLDNLAVTSVSAAPEYKPIEDIKITVRLP